MPISYIKLRFYTIWATSVTRTVQSQLLRLNGLESEAVSTGEAALYHLSSQKWGLAERGLIRLLRRRFVCRADVGAKTAENRETT